jgi:hypothetical protein
MALSELRMWVGLSSADAVRLFEQRVEVEPHWGGRWGLKPSAMEVRTCSSQPVSIFNCTSCLIVFPGHVNAGHSASTAK